MLHNNIVLAPSFSADAFELSADRHGRGESAMPFDPRLLHHSDIKYVDNAKGVTLSSILDGCISTVAARSTATY
jgi:hypothetical protein